MPAELASIGLEDFLEDEDLVQGWVGHSIENGRVFEGYTGNFYTSTVYGDVEIYSCIVHNDETDVNEVERFDLQVSGPCVWKVHCSIIDLPSITAYDMTRLVMVNSTENEAFTVMHLLNTDVLPSFLEDDEIVAQVVAYAVDVHYYKDKEAFEDTIPEIEGSKHEELNGHRLIPEMGTVFPTGFLSGHVIGEEGIENFEEDNSENDLVIITGIVKRAYVESVKINDEVVSKFIISQVETRFGDLEIIHSYSMISEEESDLIRKGSVVQAAAILSGDVAIDDYHDGFIKNEEHDLAALRYALEKGNASRLGTILADDAVLESTGLENRISGKKDVIEHIDFLHDQAELKGHTRLASMDGERCIMLTDDDEEHSTFLAKIEVNEEGMISKIILGMV